MLLFPYLLSIYLSFGGGNLIKNHRNKGERKEMDKEKRRNGGRETQLERGREGERDRDTKREKRERKREKGVTLISRKYARGLTDYTLC